MGQSTEHIEQWEQMCQNNLFLNTFVITFVEKFDRGPAIRLLGIVFLWNLHTVE